MEKLKPEERHDSIRGYFAYYLHGQMVKNKDIFVVTGGLGYGMFDKIKRDFPNRFIDVGAAEMVMMGVGVGLAMEGKIPFCYSITPFLLYRPFETIRNYVNREQWPVKLVGSGYGHDYVHDGFSHWADEQLAIVGKNSVFNSIEAFFPEEKSEIKPLVEYAVQSLRPTYINLRR